jgi:two-component system NtrC family response regulator
MARHTVLVISGGGVSHERFQKALEREFHVVTVDAVTGVETFRATRARVVVLDWSATSEDATDRRLDELAEIRRDGGATTVIVMVPADARRLAADALRQGASEVLAEPVDVDLLRLLVGRASWRWELLQERAGAPDDACEELMEMVGTSPAIRRVFSMIRKVASSDVSVLITGESGTGKELTARAIHERSARESRSFVTINCGAIPDTLLESELFGHEKGAFTGAHQQKRGKFEYAHGGTIFLDEVGELPLALQVKLLRFLQDRTIERIGGRQPIGVDARIIAATHVDLPAAIAAGRFREDLYYRLGVVTVSLPPLRERGEDVLLMARVFLGEASRQMRRPIEGFTREAIDAIRAYPWRGNVRELLNKVRRAVVMAEGSRITPEDLDLPSTGAGSLTTGLSLREARRRADAEIVAKALVLHNGNLSQTAQGLRISRPALYKLIRRHGVQLPSAARHQRAGDA